MSVVNSLLFQLSYATCDSMAEIVIYFIFLSYLEIFSPFCRDKVDGDYDNPGFRPRDGADRCTYIECSNRRTFLLECAGQEGAWPDSRYGYRYGHHRQPWFVTPHRYYHYMYRRHGRDFCRINERAFRLCQRIFGYDF